MWVDPFEEALEVIVDHIILSASEAMGYIAVWPLIVPEVLQCVELVSTQMQIHQNLCIRAQAGAEFKGEPISFYSTLFMMLRL